MKLLTVTNTKLLNFCIFLLRCTVGAILFGHGAGKVLQWFGGFGMETTIKFFSQQGIPKLLTYVSSYTEFIGGVLLIVGLFTRLVAFAVMINMLVASIVSWPSGFIAQNGAEYPFSLLISSIIILLAGPMKISLDFLLFNRDEVIRGLRRR